MKLAKLSLAAIMAVGAISAANATSLEDSIKGVSLDGYARFRFNDKKNSEGTSEYKVQAQLSAPVQENFQLVGRGVSSDSTDTNATSTNDVGFSVDRLFVNYTGFANTTITAGKQYLGTPLEDSSGTGVKAVYSMNGATLAGAYYSDTTIDTQAIAAIIAAYSNDMFGLKGAYINVADEGATKGGTGYFGQINGSIAPVSLVAQYASIKSRAAGSTKSTTLHIQASGKVSNIGLAAGYIKSGKNGGDVALDGSAHGDNDLVGAGWAIEPNATNTSYYYGKVSTSMGKVGLAAEYLSASLPSGATTGDKSELNGKISYKLSSKLSTYVKYAVVSEKNAANTNKFRFEAAYSF